MSTASAPTQAVQKVPLLLAMGATGWFVLRIVGAVGVDPSRVVALFIALLLALAFIKQEGRQ